MEATRGGCPAERFWDLSLDEALVYVEAHREGADLQRENFAWLIASVANIAGAKPKVTVDRLLRRKPQERGATENLRQNEIAAGLLTAIARSPPPPPGAQPPPQAARVSADDLERMQSAAAKPKGEVIARARPGDAPVAPAVAQANLDAFRARMRETQRRIAERKPGGGGA